MLAHLALAGATMTCAVRPVRSTRARWAAAGWAMLLNSVVAAVFWRFGASPLGDRGILFEDAEVQYLSYFAYMHVWQVRRPG